MLFYSTYIYDFGDIKTAEVQTSVSAFQPGLAIKFIYDFSRSKSLKVKLINTGWSLV